MDYNNQENKNIETTEKQSKTKIIVIASIIAVLIIGGLFLILGREKEYVVSFDTNGGVKIANQIVEEGTTIGELKEPTREGYTFEYWSYNGERMYSDDEITEDMKLTAIWTIKTEEGTKYEISFNTDGAGKIEKQILEEGEKVKKPKTPEKKGYKFKHWSLNGKEYDFNKEVTSSFELMAIWEKEEDKKTDNNKTNNKTNNTTPASTTKPNSNQQASSSNQTIKLSTPKITKGGKGGDSSGTIGIELKLNSIEGITGVEVYSATSEKGTYKLIDTVKKENLNNQAVNVYAKPGEHYFYKVRTYLKNNKGTVYSAYSNVIELNNELSTPTITSYFLGAVAFDDEAIAIKSDNVDNIKGIEVYYSKSSSGTYTLLKTVQTTNLINGNAVEVNLKYGEKFYYKVRTYVEYGNQKYYSAYSNVIELKNKIQPPIITSQFLGGVAYGDIGVALKLEYVYNIKGVEVYYSAEENGSYTLLKNIDAANLINGNAVEVNLKYGEKFYYKVRTYVEQESGKYYSDYSNIIELSNK